jgi:surface antigen
MQLKASRYLPAVVCLLFLPAVWGPADSQTPEERRVIESTIVASMSSRSGVELIWRRGDAVGTVTPEPAFSLTTGETCRAEPGAPCDAPCRSVTWTFSTSTTNAEYRGTRCLQGGAWTMLDPDIQISSTVAIITAPPTGGSQPVVDGSPGIPPPEGPTQSQIMIETQSNLRDLLYYTGTLDGISGPRTDTAIEGFLDDERSDIAPHDIEAVNRLLVEAKRRLVNMPCPPSSQSTPYRACGLASE